MSPAELDGREAKRALALLCVVILAMIVFAALVWR